MKVKVSLYVAGQVIEEVVTAMRYEDAKKLHSHGIQPQEW